MNGVRPPTESYADKRAAIAVAAVDTNGNKEKKENAVVGILRSMTPAEREERRKLRQLATTTGSTYPGHDPARLT